MKDRHPNSYIVTIIPRKHRVARIQNKDVDVFAQALKKIGSYFAKNSTQVASGLTREEEDVLMPDIIKLLPSDRDYRQEIATYFSRFSTTVPEAGIELEIGLEKSNDLPVSKDNLPINVLQYIRYRHAILHPQVASSEEIAQTHHRYNFYILDRSKDIVARKKRIQLEEAAETIYFGIKNSIDKMEAYLTNLGLNPILLKKRKEVTDDESYAVVLAEELRRITFSTPKLLVDVHEDGDFQIKYILKSLLNAGILVTSGAAYLVKDTNELIGSDEKQAITFFKGTEKNGIAISTLKAKYANVMNKKLSDEVRAEKAEAKEKKPKEVTDKDTTGK